MTSTAILRRSDGTVLDLDGQVWVEDVTEVDLEVLTRASGPVLDVGCGPGRHAQALAERGETVLGIDLSNHAVQIARNKGLEVLQQSVFDSLPNHGEWACALLLDGNIGIGGDPESLLQRLNQALQPGGSILIEAQPETNEPAHQTVRLEIDGEPGPWFPWAHVNIDLIKAIANDIGLNVEETWTNGGRHFVHLSTILTI